MLFFPRKPFAHFVSFLVIAFPLLALSGCERQPQVYQQQILALGTLIDISLYDVNDETAAAAVRAITGRMEQIHHDWHAWQPGKLTYINQQLASGNSVVLDDEQRGMISKGIELARRSNDLFNPAMGNMIALWGFHTDNRPNDIAPPNADEINALLQAAPHIGQLQLEDNQLNSQNPAIKLDVGGYAKGYAVDQAIDILRDMGIHNAIVNAGGDLRAVGSKGDKPWRIGIRHPRQPGVIASLQTRDDESVFTSGDYERYFTYQGERYHHIIDPRSGRPARGTTSVTIISEDATSADAAATAVFIAGPEDWRETARNMGINEVMLIDSQGVVYMTEAMAERIWFEIDPPPRSIILP